MAAILSKTGLEWLRVSVQKCGVGRGQLLCCQGLGQEGLLLKTQTLKCSFSSISNHTDIAGTSGAMG